jgi:aminoglycoside 3-N-acetyltransferase
VSIEREIVAGMLGGAVPRDGVLVVHSGFKKLKDAGCSAEGVIEELAAAIPDGTLVMPTMSWRICTPQNPVFDELATPSHVGALPELFRTKYATHRSLHPTHSVGALGTRAARLTAEHHLGNTPCAKNSPYGLMEGFPAYVLMIDTGFERCTAIHVPEEDLAPDLYMNPLSEAATYELRDRHGGVHSMKLRTHRRLNRCFEKFEAMLAGKGKLQQGTVSGSSYLLCSLADLLGEIYELGKTDPRATLAPDGVPTRLSSPVAAHAPAAGRR